MKRFILSLFLIYPLFAISLSSLVDIGLQKSTVIKKSRADIDYARVQRDENRAKQMGSIDLVASYTHYNLPRTLAPLSPITMKDPVASANIATTEDLFGTGVSYSVALFTGFAHTREIEIDAIAQRIAQSKHSLTKEQLVYNIRALYLSTLATQEMLKAQRGYVSALKKLKTQIAIEVDLGKKAEIDLIKAQSDLEGNRAYLEVLKETIVISKASLASLVGIKRVKSLKSIRVSVKRPNYSIERLLRKASRLNKIKIANLNISRANKVIQKSKSGNLPQVSLSSYYGYNYGANDSSNPNSGDWNSENNWQVGVNVKWNMVDFGKSSASTQKARILHLKSSLEKQQNLLDLKKSLIEASAKLKQEYASYRGNLKQLRLARKSEKIESVRYINDATTLNDLLYAKSKTHLANAKLIQSRYNYQKGKYYMDYLLEKGERK